MKKTPSRLEYPLAMNSLSHRCLVFFGPREKQSSLDGSEYMEVARNYESAVEDKVGLEVKFGEDESRGRMFPMTMGVLKERCKDQHTLVAAMGAIKKPGGSVRPIHDGAHFVQVSNGSVFTDKLDYPGPPDVACRDCAPGKRRPRRGSSQFQRTSRRLTA